MTHIMNINYMLQIKLVYHNHISVQRFPLLSRSLRKSVRLVGTTYRIDPGLILLT